MSKHHSPGFLKLVADAKSRVREWSVAEVAQRRQAGETMHLVDVREDHEFAAGRIPGAVHLGRGILERDIEHRFPDHDAPLVLYCGGGYRSALAADNLQRMGYTRVVSMDGGFGGWREAGLPIDTAAADGPA